ncbi:type I restriction-modification system DNA methylase subunit [Paenibacillus sp. RC73]|uniref:N-6 DNA methylase n=1 Tax=Paenibacillus sp. RC73 TaxID=3156250 RepID=UPI00383913F2
MLLTVQGQLPGGDKPGAIKFFGQEKNTTTYNFARMNLMMHGVSLNNMTLSNADTLESDWPDGPDAQGIDNPRSFDAVVEVRTCLLSLLFESIPTKSSSISGCP